MQTALTMLVSHGGGHLLNCSQKILSGSFLRRKKKQCTPASIAGRLFWICSRPGFLLNTVLTFFCIKIASCSKFTGFSKNKYFSGQVSPTNIFQICWQEIFYSLCVNAMSRSDQALELESPLSLTLVKKNFNVRNVVSQIESKNYHSADGSDIISIPL